VSQSASQAGFVAFKLKYTGTFQCWKEYSDVRPASGKVGKLLKYLLPVCSTPGLFGCTCLCQEGAQGISEQREIASQLNPWNQNHCVSGN
jgi:hypothetical protein